MNAKRSVSLGLYDDDGKLINVGNVTVPNDQAIPKVGDIVDIRYLYAYPDGSLYQPTLIGVRDDIPVSDCVASQRKFVGELDLIEEEAEAVEEAAEDDALVPAP